jgi:hypothetical protein
MSKVLTLMEVVAKAHEYLNSKPELETKGYNDVYYTDSVPNPKGQGYDSCIEVYVGERFAQIKVRDSDLLVEYQLCMTPWKPGFHIKYWYDGIGKNPWEGNMNLGFKYNMTEEQYFQESTVHDFKGLTLEDIEEVQKLQNRFFQYVNITPCGVD